MYHTYTIYVHSTYTICMYTPLNNVFVKEAKDLKKIALYASDVVHKREKNVLIS